MFRPVGKGEKLTVPLRPTPRTPLIPDEAVVEPSPGFLKYFLEKDKEAKGGASLYLPSDENDDERTEYLEGLEEELTAALGQRKQWVDKLAVEAKTPDITVAPKPASPEADPIDEWADFGLDFQDAAVQPAPEATPAPAGGRKRSVRNQGNKSSTKKVKGSGGKSK